MIKLKKIIFIIFIIFLYNGCNKTPQIKKVYTDEELKKLTDNCKKCHGNNFDQAPYSFIDPPNIFTKNTLYETLYKYKWTNYSKYNFNDMNIIMSEYSDEEIAAISNYIYDNFYYLKNN